MLKMDDLIAQRKKVLCLFCVPFLSPTDVLFSQLAKESKKLTGLEAQIKSISSPKKTKYSLEDLSRDFAKM